MENVIQCVDDCCRWTVLELQNFRHGREHRLQKALSYLEDAKELIEAEIEKIDEEEICNTLNG